MKRNLYFYACSVALLVSASATVVADDDCPFEGIWVGTNENGTTNVVSFVSNASGGLQIFIAPSESLGTPSYPNGFPAGIGLMGDVYHIKNGKAEYRAILNGIQRIDDDPLAQRIYIRIQEGTLTMTDCNRIEADSILSFWQIADVDPSPDEAPKDGLPDEGVEPNPVIPIRTTLQRFSPIENDDDNDDGDDD